MNRREFLKATAVGAAAISQAPYGQALAATSTTAAGEVNEYVGACGLYCGICLDKINNKCHGCGCPCGNCAGAGHKKGCAIAKCAAKRKLESCADCPELPCTRLIQFTNDPIWLTHGPAIENLRRRKVLGTAGWLKEQEEFWRDKKAREKWLNLYAECGRRYADSQKKQSEQ